MKERARTTRLWRSLCAIGLLAFALGAWAGPSWAADEILARINLGSDGVGSSLEEAIADAGFGSYLGSISNLVVETRGTYAFSLADWNYIKNLPNLTTLYLGAVDLTQPGSVADVPQDFLNGRTTLETVTLPTGTQTIGARAFYGCTALDRLLETGFIATIGESAFEGCTMLTDDNGGQLQLPYVRSIGTNAFKGCTEIKYFYAPSLGNSTGDLIGENAFQGITGINKMLFGKNLPPTGGHIFAASPVVELYTQNTATANNSYGSEALYFTYMAPTRDPALSLTPTSLQLSAGGAGKDVETFTTLGDNYKYGPYFWTITGNAATLSGFQIKNFDPNDRAKVTVVPGNRAGSGTVTLLSLTGLYSSGNPLPSPFNNLAFPFSASIPYTVTGSDPYTPPSPPSPIPTVAVSVTDTSTSDTTRASLSGTTWWASVPSGFAQRTFVVTMVKDGRTYKSAPLSFVIGTPQQVEVKTEDGSASEKIWVGLKIIGKEDAQPTWPTQETVDRVNDWYRSKLSIRAIIGNPVDLYINTLPYKPSTVSPNLRDYILRATPEILDYLSTFVDQKPKVPADPVVVAAGLTFKISSTLGGVTVEKPADLPDALNKLSLNKIFDVDANGTPTMMDLFELMKPYLENGAITYNPFTGELKINAPITVVDGPVPAGAAGVVHPVPGSKYGAIFHPEGGLLIYDGVEDGIVFDPIALMKKAPAPATLSLSPATVSMDIGGTRDVTATGGSVTWTVADGKIARIEPTNTPGVYKVTGLAAGSTTMTAKLDADPAVTATLSVTVAAPRSSGGSSGCDAGAFGLFGLLLLCALRLRSGHEGCNGR